MALLNGSVAASRFSVVRQPVELDFEPAAFREIAAGSEVRESTGFVPFEPEADYKVGAGRWAFRVRIDKLKADPTSVRERLKQLIKAEIEMSGLPFVGSKKRKELRHLAEEELVVGATPKSTLIECCLDGGVLWVGSASKGVLGTVLLLLHRIGVQAKPKTPWRDQGLPEAHSEIVEITNQSESAHGCHFLNELLGDRDFMFEPVAGRVRLATRDALMTLTGCVLPELHQQVRKGAEILAGKLVSDETTFTLDGPTFRLSGVKLPGVKAGHWTELLDLRLAQLEGVYDQLEAKFQELMA